MWIFTWTCQKNSLSLDCFSLSSDWIQLDIFRRVGTDRSRFSDDVSSLNCLPACVCVRTRDRDRESDFSLHLVLLSFCVGRCMKVCVSLDRSFLYVGFVAFDYGSKRIYDGCRDKTTTKKKKKEKKLRPDIRTGRERRREERTPSPSVHRLFLSLSSPHERMMMMVNARVHFLRSSNEQISLSFARLSVPEWREFPHWNELNPDQSLYHNQIISLYWMAVRGTWEYELSCLSSTDSVDSLSIRLTNLIIIFSS